MTISIYASGEQAISTPGGWDLIDVAGPGAFVGYIDLSHQNGLEVRLLWFVDDHPAGTAAYWSEHVTADNTTVDGVIAILSPPVPIVSTGRLHLDFYSGTPGDPTIPWMVYQL